MFVNAIPLRIIIQYTIDIQVFLNSTYLSKVKHKTLLHFYRD